MSIPALKSPNRTPLGGDMATSLSTTKASAIGIPQATILISKAVAISGAPDASIEAGTIPFYIAAPGATVTIQEVRFVRPRKSAILVYAVSGLMIASCSIDGIVPLPKHPVFGNRD